MVAAHLRKVLYIEDDPSIRQLVQLTLEEKGNLEVRCCGSWNEALDLARTDKPDLFLLDVMLPEKDGVETLKTLRKLQGMEHVPAIFLTVDVELSTAEPEDLGPHGIIAKPFEVDKLFPALQSHWEKLSVTV